MKKLMIAAAAAAMIGGAFAECSDLTEACLCYDINVTLKTLGAKEMNCKGTCADTRVAYLDNATRTLKGYAWSCDYDCECDAGNTELKFALWEPKATLAWSFFYPATGKTDNALDMKYFIRYGKKGGRAAISPFTLEFLGTDWNAVCDQSSYKLDAKMTLGAVNGVVAYNKKLNDCIVKSIAGYVLGEVATDVRCSKSSAKTTKGNLCGDDTTTVTCCSDLAPVYACICLCDVNWCEAVVDDKEYFDGKVVPAVGTWSMKYNTTLSKGKTYIGNMIPDYAQAVEP